MQNPILSATQVITALSQRFWQREGTLQTYFDFLLSEIDPMFSLKRKTAEVIQIIDETIDTKTFILRPSSRWAGFNPGQYINIETEINGVTVRRNYSISSSPQTFRLQQLISITVKRIDGGRVSSHLHNRLAIGDIMTISDAAGEFTLEPEASSKGSVFIAAGSGITPIMSMISQMNEQLSEQPITLIYYVNTPQDLIFESALTMISTHTSHIDFIPHFTEAEGYITERQIASDCPDIVDRDIYLCGPQEFMASVNVHCGELGVAQDDIKQESFGGAINTAHKTDTQGQVSFLKSGKNIKSDGNKTLLELAEGAGLTPKYGCRSGICHECKCTKTSGRVLNTLTGELMPDDQSHIQACISIPVGDLSIDSL